ncbi:cAMP-regulated D2 protein-like isoform X3 [Physella acuta]|uniref:cAMP-regulated D2 protein-like isoform X2 n=1 Tax=Physella acuta TaxID=109671 RepID=UPI0027DACA27|nr:cAMP-regulated D2 protein-like isoform X2 [Physella acuta]XP_059164844.1 cAMP-regulated D2 protein-like isoform X3 [Physella acuta]
MDGFNGTTFRFNLGSRRLGVGKTMSRGLLALSFLSCAILSVLGREVIVQTSHGKVKGISDGLTVAFRGVPFASPPVGKLRWLPPQPPAPWAHVLAADVDPPGCPQIGCEKLTPTIACPKKMSEDCLYLNIFAPDGAGNTSGLPVMAYIHGGNFFDMSGSSPLFDGVYFTQRGNVVQVNLNYRLGALGFLVTGDGDDDARGNYGLYDQVLALKWIRDNIRQFGGDPEKVTLFGQSAGAQSVIQHMTLDETAGLFQRAIIESSPLALPYKTYTEAFVLGGLLAEAVGCPVRDMDCLRAKTAEEITQASLKTRSEVASLKFLEMFEPYGPHIDGRVVKGQPLDVYGAGGYQKKPIMIGSTREETVLYIYGAYNKTVTVIDYLALLLAVRPDKVIEMAEHYPPTSLEDQREVLVNISTDLVFGCPTRNLSRTLLDQGSGDVWLYLWDHAFSFPGWGQVTFCEGRVCHGTEIVYVFHTANKGNFTFTADEEALSSDLISYWTNFAWSGDPNTRDVTRQRPRQTDQMAINAEATIHLGHQDMHARLDISSKVRGQLTPWPKYSPTSQWPAMHFLVPSRTLVHDYRDQFCQFWDGIGYGADRA